MKTCWSLALAAALLPWMACLDFESQSLTYRYFAASDVMVIFQNYEGVHGTSQADGLDATERDQLASVFEGPRTFFFSNWILEYNAPQVRQRLAELRNDAQSAPEVRKATMALLELLLENVTIQSGPFYLNADGKTSGIQRVTVRRFAKILAAANAALRAELLARPAKDGEDVFQQGLRRHARAHADFIIQKGQRIEAHLPAGWDTIWVTLHGEDSSILKAVPKMLEGGFEFALRHNQLVLAAGAVEGNATTLRMTNAEGKYRPNAAGYLEEKHGLKRTFDVARAQREFFEESSRQFGKAPSKP